MRRRVITDSRRGFALLTVLWMLAGLTTIGALMQFTARESVMASRRRIELLESAWRAEDCVSRARAAIDGALRNDAGESAERPRWRRLDTAVAASPVGQGCPGTLTMVPLGAVVDLNEASREQLRRLLDEYVSAGVALDSAVDGIMDWRDADPVPRLLGAERTSYAERGRRAPRNGPFADVRELTLVLGLEGVDVDTIPLGVESGRVSIAVAPAEVLASLPGMTQEAIAVIEDLRRRDALPTELLHLVEYLGDAARDSLLAHRLELELLAVMESDGWVVTAFGSSGRGAAGMVVEVRLVRAGERVAVVRRRTWPQ
jgi:type II secretory pathway component PulK